MDFYKIGVYPECETSHIKNRAIQIEDVTTKILDNRDIDKKHIVEMEACIKDIGECCSRLRKLLEVFEPKVNEESK